MSYILNRGTKGRPPPSRRSKPPPPPSTTTIRTAAASNPRGSSRSSSGGQIQIQKPQDQKLKQRVKETMSMEKVMADLRILEEQQAESERKLKYAQELKQRRLEGLRTSEQKWHELQYKNGQMRACMDRHRDTLSINQRRVLEMKKDAKDRGDELSTFSEEVEMLHYSMQALARICRQHQSYIDTYEKKLGFLRAMVDESFDQVQELEQELHAIQDRQDTLQDIIRQETLAEQQTLQEISDLRQEILELEQSLTDATNEETKQNKILGQVEAELASVQEQRRAAEESHKKKTTDLQDEITSLSEKKKTLGSSVDERKKELHALWSEVVDLQTAEGHPPSLLFSQTNDLPTIDLNTIQESLQKETSAVEAEQLAETQLVDCIESLADRLKQCNIEFETATAELETEKESIVKQLVEEEHRKQAKEKEIEEIQKHQKSLEEMEAVTKPLKQMADEDRLAHQKELQDIEAEESILQAELDEVLAERVKIEERLAAKAEQDAIELATLEDTLAKERERSKELDATIQDFEKLCKHNFSPEEIAERKKDAEIAQREIDRCIEKYPQLEHLEITYRKDLSSSEQIDIDLADLKASVSAKAEELKQLRGESKSKSRSTKDYASNQTTKPTSGKDGSKDLDEYSVAKPQSLLHKFVEASQEEGSEEDEDTIPFDDQSKSTIESQYEKRVHWRRDEGTVGSDDVTEKVKNSSQTQVGSVQSRPKSSVRETLARGKGVGKASLSRFSKEKDKLSSHGIFDDHHIHDQDDEMPPIDQRKRGGSNERNPTKSNVGKGFTKKKPSVDSKVGGKRRPFAATVPERSENSTSAKRSSKHSAQQKPSRSSVHKQPSARQDRKPSKDDTTEHTERRQRSGVMNKILKRSRGNDDSSANGKSAKRSFKSHATEKEKNHTTQDSKKRRRRPKSKSSTWANSDLPEISFA